MFKFSIWVIVGGKNAGATPLLSVTTEDAPPVPPLPYRIIIVDSHFQDHYRLKQVLSPLGVDLRTASSNQEALTLWLEWQPHLLFVDLQGAIINNQSIAQYIHQETQKPNSTDLRASLLATKVIALVPQGQDPSTLDLAASDFDDVLYWPSQHAHLLEVLSQHLPLTDLAADIPSGLSQPALTAPPPYPRRAAIEQTPLGWRQQLYQAAITGSDDKLLSLIAQLPAEQMPLAQLLNTLVENFQFDQIIALLSDEW